MCDCRTTSTPLRPPLVVLLLLARKMRHLCLRQEGREATEHISSMHHGLVFSQILLRETLKNGKEERLTPGAGSTALDSPRLPSAGAVLLASCSLVYTIFHSSTSLLETRVVTNFMS